MIFIRGGGGGAVGMTCSMAAKKYVNILENHSSSNRYTASVLLHLVFFVNKEE